MRIKALLLAGGYGKRLRPLTDSIPKPLIDVAGRPILEYQIHWLKSQGISDFVIACGWLHEKVQEYFGDGSKLGVRIEYSVEPEPLGTGGGIKWAQSKLEDAELFVVTNGDIIMNLPLKPLLDVLQRHPEFVGAIALTPLPSPYGIVKFEGDRVISFVEKPLLPDYYINAGLYVFRREIFEYLPDRGDIERTAFPRLAEEGRLGCHAYSGEDIVWLPIDTLKDLERARKLVPELIRQGKLPFVR